MPVAGLSGSREGPLGPGLGVGAGCVGRAGGWDLVSGAGSGAMTGGLGLGAGGMAEGGAAGAGAGAVVRGGGVTSASPAVNLTETSTSLNICWNFSIAEDGARHEIRSRA